MSGDYLKIEDMGDFQVIDNRDALLLELQRENKELRQAVEELTSRLNELEADVLKLIREA